MNKEKILLIIQFHYDEYKKLNYLHDDILSYTSIASGLELGFTFCAEDIEKILTRGKLTRKEYLNCYMNTLKETYSSLDELLLSVNEKLTNNNFNNTTKAYLLSNFESVINQLVKKEQEEEKEEE